MSLAYDRKKDRSSLEPLIAHLAKNHDLSSFVRQFGPADVTDLCELAHFLADKKPRASRAVLKLAQGVVRAAGLAAEVFVPATIASAASPRSLSPLTPQRKAAGFSLRKGVCA